MQSTDVPILYQDHHLLLVNKPAGMVIHPTYKHAEDTLWNILLNSLEQLEPDSWQPPVLPDEPGWERAPAPVREMLRAKREAWWRAREGLLPRPALLHRLDKDTSGIVALARTAVARLHIVRQFQSHRIVKRYLAVASAGAPDWTRPRAPFTVTLERPDGILQEQSSPFYLPAVREGTLVLEGAIARDPAERRRCVVGPQGQAATTRVEVLTAERGFALLAVHPITGRIHQIRAHMAALGYALIGDQTYALPSATQTLNRQFLHASSLTLRTYPEDLPRTFKAPLATDLHSWLTDHFPEGLEAYNATS